MGRSSDSRASAPVMPLKLAFARPSPKNRFSSPASDPFASSYSSLTSSSSSAVSAAASLFQRSTSPTRVNLRPSSPPPAPSMRISLDRPLSPSRSVSVRDQVVPRRNEITKAKRTCMCSPTSHPGSFRCSYHRNLSNNSSRQSVSCSPMRLNLRRSAMTNSLVRIGTVEGDWVKRALSALIRPSSHQQRRRGGFQPRPSRLSGFPVNVVVSFVAVIRQRRRFVRLNPGQIMKIEEWKYGKDPLRGKVVPIFVTLTLFLQSRKTTMN
ncbi:hypothetical protein V2J09_013493 [Rumex salicifolius]